MIRCPRCQSPNILSNKLEAEHIDRAMQVAQATQAFGVRRVSVLAGLGVIAIQAMNELRKDCRCADCAYRFDE